MAKNKLSKLTGGNAAVDYPVPTASYKPNAAERERQRRYAAEDALRTLTRSDEIRRDRQLMSDVKQLARQQVKSLTGITGRKR